MPTARSPAPSRRHTMLERNAAGVYVHSLYNNHINHGVYSRMRMGMVDELGDWHVEGEDAMLRKQSNKLSAKARGE